MWLLAEFQPTALFSLKTSMATGSAAKTLFLPSPFAIKMALLDAAIRTRGVNYGSKAFPWLARMRVAVLPPSRVVVTNLFAKVLKPRRGEAPSEETHDEEGAVEPNAGQTMGPFQKTIAFREYAYLQGAMALALEVDANSVDELKALLPQISYFGKRGSFFQLTAAPEQKDALPEGFVILEGSYLKQGEVRGGFPSTFSLASVVQVLDDCGPDLTFEKADIYSDARITAGRDRIFQSVLLPYKLIASSRGFSHYERSVQQST